MSETVEPSAPSEERVKNYLIFPPTPWIAEKSSVMNRYIENKEKMNPLSRHKVGVYPSGWEVIDAQMERGTDSLYVLYKKNTENGEVYEIQIYRDLNEQPYITAAFDFPVTSFSPFQKETIVLSSPDAIYLTSVSERGEHSVVKIMNLDDGNPVLGILVDDNGDIICHTENNLFFFYYKGGEGIFGKKYDLPEGSTFKRGTLRKGHHSYNYIIQGQILHSFFWNRTAESANFYPQYNINFNSYCFDDTGALVALYSGSKKINIFLNNQWTPIPYFLLADSADAQKETEIIGVTKNGEIYVRTGNTIQTI